MRSEVADKRIGAGRGKTITFCTVVLGLSVAAVAVFSFRHTLYESWLIYRLGSKDDKTRIATAETLAGMKSVRAVPHFVEIIRNDSREDIQWPFQGIATIVTLSRKTRESSPPRPSKVHREAKRYTPILYWLLQVGPDTNEILDKAIEEEHKRVGKIENAWTFFHGGWYTEPGRPSSILLQYPGGEQKRLLILLQEVKRQWAKGEAEIQRIDYPDC